MGAGEAEETHIVGTVNTAYGLMGTAQWVTLPSLKHSFPTPGSA